VGYGLKNWNHCAWLGCTINVDKTGTKVDVSGIFATRQTVIVPYPGLFGSRASGYVVTNRFVVFMKFCPIDAHSVV
jgi:hypothetical protein